MGTKKLIEIKEMEKDELHKKISLINDELNELRRKDIEDTYGVRFGEDILCNGERLKLDRIYHNHWVKAKQYKKDGSLSSRETTIYDLELMKPFTNLS